jgi:asparagine synthase (glutamine-hydrolysing)
MCGIFFSNNSEKINIKKLSQHMRFRGPDDQDILIEGNNIIAHSRLAITGVDNGAQPFLHSNYIAVCNGEIYNYKEIIKRYDLTPQTESDCEVIPLLYEKYGVEKFDELDGMYAFIIYDKRNKRVLWARDHIGEKPLYFYKSSQAIYLTSEINYLKATDVNLVPDYFGLLEAVYLQFNREHTPFLNLSESEPNVLYTYDFVAKKIFESNIQNSSYEISNLSSNEICEEYSMKVRSAVETTLRQGEFTPFLGYTSGYDSNLIRYVAGKNNIPVKLITIGYSGNEKYDEIRNIDLQKKATIHQDSYEHYKCVLTQEDLEMAYMDSIKVRDALVLDGSGTSYYLLMKFVKEFGGKVFISGHGGDDVLLAYPWIRSMLGYLDVSDRDGQIKKAITSVQQLIRIKRLMNRRIWSYRSYYSDVRKILDPRLGNLENRSERGILSPNEAFNEIVYGYLSRSGLLQMDRYSMHFGIESRTPLVRKNLLTFAMQNIQKITKIEKTRKTLYSHVQGFGENFNNNIKRGFRTPLNSNTERTRQLYKRHTSKFLLEILDLSVKELDTLGINAVRALSSASIFYKGYGHY